MSSGGSYLEGATVRLQATFAVSGVNTDPTTVTLKVKDAAGTTSTYTYALAQVTKSAVGVYYKDVALTLESGRAQGSLTYRWIGTGAAAGVGEETIVIAGSEID
jgi:hypothetical protein